MSSESYRLKEFSGFSKLDRKQRLKVLLQLGFISDHHCAQIQSNQMLDFSHAENFIENAIGYYALPLGVAVGFVIDDEDVIVPMAIEETSVVAAASKTAIWIRDNGRIETKSEGKLSIGQLQIAKLKDPKKFDVLLEKNKKALIEDLNKGIASSMVKRSGGVKDLYVRKIKRPDKGIMGVIHILVDTCDAMGANIVNQICESIKNPIENLTGEKINICILSNMNDQKLTQAKIILEGIDPILGNSIAEASLFAEIDPYRAATNNKGACNAMDAVLIATGNDWRAVESGVHAYAVQKGRYQAITKWNYTDGLLTGVLKAPINVGIIGGITNLHPTALACLDILKATSAERLAQIVAAVGLVQNLAALRALTTDGITCGHMKLHIDNLCCSVKASQMERASLKKLLEKILKKNKSISHKDVKNALEEIRNNSR